MTRDNLELALKLNNDVIIQEINLIVDYVNDLASDQKITNYELERSIKANSISGVSDRLEALETTVTNNFHDINEDYSAHKNNSAIHVTQSDKDNWNSSKTYTDQELSDHASNKNLHVTKNLQDTWNDHVNDTVIHVVQSDKDYWNSILNISKQYAKQLFDSVTSINLIKCEELPEEDIQELTIYMLKIAEGSEEENDLYDEYMYIDGEWERIGSTRVNLEDYVTKTLLQTELGYISQSITAIQQQLHSHTNINILNKLSEDNSGNLLYDNNKISAKSSMSEIIDVNLTNLSNGDTLKYNSTDQKWENKPDNVLEIDDASTSNSKLWSSNKTNTEINKSYKDTDSAGTTIADNDYFPFYDTSASDKKKSTWSNVKSVLKTYFDTLYSTVTSRGTPTSAGTALSLVNTGDMYNWNTDTVIYCTCSTGASTTAKVVSVSRGTFTLTAGAKVCVKFTYANTAEAPTLNVSSKGAKNIKYIGIDGTVETPNIWWGAGDVVTFVYDGTQWLMQPTLAIAQPNVTYGFTPVGTVISVMGNSAPTNYLKCDGTVYNISSYPELANYFYAQFGSKNKFGGNGTTTFAVPDLRGEFLRGTGTNGHSGQGSGLSVGSHQDATLHLYYGYNNGNNLWYQSNHYMNSSDMYPTNYENLLIDSSAKTGKVYRPGEKFTGTGEYAYRARPTNTSVLYCIAVKDIYMNPADTYSTNEQVVGTWIDGSYLYQRTFTGTFPSSLNSEGNITIASSFSYTPVEMMGYCYYKEGTIYGSIHMPYSDGTSALILQSNSSTKTLEFYYTGGSGLGYLKSRPYYVTIKYIK